MIITKLKKPLVFTNRAKRLYLTNMIFNIILVALFVLKTRNFLEAPPAYAFFALVILIVLLGILYYLQAFLMLISNNSLKPIEKRINMGFYEQAQEKIKSRADLIVVGITGSFGKTSTSL